MNAFSARTPWQREQQRSAIANKSFDIVVIGGGATGAGVFLDAISRGLSCALIERQDFTAGTSSHSTKLVHGGVRYLEQAVKQFDLSKYKLVKEALAERKRMLAMAPHLAWPLNLVTPVKQLIGIPYFRIGLGVYDFLSGDQQLGPSLIENKADLKKICPTLDVDALAGGVSYFDGQFDDARFGIAMVRTGLEMGGHALNYAQVTDLIKQDNRVTGVRCKDLESGNAFNVNAKVVVNCTGPWTDSLRRQANPDCKKMMTVSTGAHIVIRQNLLPQNRGILIPKTADGRVLFMLPWLGKTLVGTTDEGCELTDNPVVSEDEVRYILQNINGWLSEPIERKDITATWTGLRPLVIDPKKSSTAELTRDHVVLEDAGLISLTGGKWTTWRKMAEDCMDFVCRKFELTSQPCQTYDLHLAGARGDSQAAKHALAHLPEDIRDHLWQAYGDRASAVLVEGSHKRLLASEPYIEAELDWIIKYEGVCHVDDLLKRRLRIGMLDEKSAQSLRSLVESKLTEPAMA